MPIVKIKAKDFDTRTDLDNEVIRLTGSGVEAKPDYLITGKRAELLKLRLNENRAVYGVKVESTDIQTPKKEKSTADRGAVHPFGINELKIKAKQR